jgi:phosphoribosyl 1,2-cyclic phosphodiesterase
VKFTFLGTAAANAFPEAFCRCVNCTEARRLGGPSLRKRTAALINDDLLLDLGPDIMTAAQLHDCPLHNVRYCLQTHPHADHLDLSHLLSRSPDFGTAGAPCLHFYASAETMARAAQTFDRDLSGDPFLDPATQQQLNYQTEIIEPLRPFAIGPYRVIAFPANHAPGMGALLYAIEEVATNRSILYGTDTAIFFEEMWAALHQHNLRFDLVVLDHTYGPEQPGSDHLSAHQVIEQMERLRAEGLLKDDGRVFATHIAHEGNPAHPTLVAFAQAHGYEIGYDGLVIQV